MESVAKWAADKRLSIAPLKSGVTIFTPDPHQFRYEPKISLNGVQIPTDRTPKILGVRLDYQLRFNHHIDNIVATASNRLQILKALAGTTWGQTKELLLITYKAMVLPILCYAAPIWFPNVSATNIGRLQRIQNEALRIVTGCHRMSNVHHLHSECRIMPIKDHLQMLCAQFLANAKRVGHVSHDVVSSGPGRRSQRFTLQSKVGAVVEPFLVDGVMPAGEYRQAINRIHTTAVSEAISNQTPNRVLGINPPPPIAAEEAQLGRRHRVVLAQLRSGRCCLLKDYNFAINKVVDDLCPECRADPHTVPHLFACPAAPTHLTAKDLWDRPRRAVEFLGTLSSFDQLPPSIPLPPPHPPRPP